MLISQFKTWFKNADQHLFSASTFFSFNGVKPYKGDK